MEDNNRQDAFENALEKKYNGMNNRTEEILKPGSVLCAKLSNCIMPIGGSTLHMFENDEICEMRVLYYYDGKERVEPADELVISGMLIRGSSFSLVEDSNVIVLEIDGERIECKKARIKSKDKGSWEPTIAFNFNDGVNEYTNAYGIIFGFALEFEYIKKIAEANNVLMYIDSGEAINLDGGVFNFLNRGNYQIEGIQGLMKRAYHFFVDETCYTDYCVAFYNQERHGMVGLYEINKKRKEEYDRKKKQEEQENYESAIKLRNILFVVLFVSVLLIILNLSCDWDSTFWTLILPLIAGGYSVYKLGNLYDLW